MQGILENVAMCLLAGIIIGMAGLNGLCSVLNAKVLAEIKAVRIAVRADGRGLRSEETFVSEVSWKKDEKRYEKYVCISGL